jgi:hypothetical protein
VSRSRLKFSAHKAREALEDANPEFPISNLPLHENHTSATLARQVQMDIAALGSHRGSLGRIADLLGLFLASNLPGR